MYILPSTSSSNITTKKQNRFKILVPGASTMTMIMQSTNAINSVIQIYNKCLFGYLIFASKCVKYPSLS